MSDLKWIKKDLMLNYVEQFIQFMSIYTRIIFKISVSGCTLLDKKYSYVLNSLGLKLLC